MRKALLLTEIFPPATGGSARWFWEIYSRLPCDRVCVAAGGRAGDRAFDGTNDLAVLRLPLSLRDTGFASWRGLRGYYQLVRSIYRICRERQIEVVHCGRCLPEGWIGWLLYKLHGIPYICYAHGEEVKLPTSPSDSGVMSSRQHRFMASRSLRSSSLVIANSANTQNILRDEWNIPAEHLRILHPGVDTKRFCPVARGEDVRQMLGWSGRRVILTVGRLQKRKGHDRMIRALLQVRQSVPNVLYAIIGEGAERQQLESLTYELGVGEQVRFHGEVSDDIMTHCYQQCDLFVLPNRQVGSDIEGFGMVLLEAQACGKPVIAGASGGTSETMCADSGAVIACEESDLLAELVARWLSDEQKLAEMGRAARRWVVNRFDWSSLAEQAHKTLTGEFHSPVSTESR